ncbi:hypothetical protein GLOIN_2v1480119 [Rhizophagus irregularis DAOM 181602=DAOM 197198]|nr:hypothetical protein GLOIN_2v1480119 [Rhizophagus irregularis DAOM 181602=DAOM 197198]
MLAKDIYNELMKFVESGELEAEDVPKITTIQNWISTYARTFKEQATENMVKDIRDLEICSQNVVFLHSKVDDDKL